MRKLTGLFFILMLAVYYFSSAGKTPYDYFTRLADSFLQGRYYLTENPSWLSELIPAGESKYYVVYPPMPAILSMVPRFILKEGFEQQYLAHILGAGTVALTMLISWVVKKDIKLAVWSGTLVGLGSIVWFLSATGSSWYLGQVSAAFFLTVAIYEGLTKKRPFVVGILLGGAFLSRIHTIFSFPLFLYLIYDKDWFRRYFVFGLGILPFILFNFLYNFIRFGSIFDQGYFILPQVLNELNKPWFSKGVINISYIPDNLHTMFLSFPKVMKSPPYIEPSWAGLSIWITTPAFVFSLFASLKEKLNMFLWLAILPIFLIVISHGGTGWAQFGYRFAVDFYPFLTLLTIRGVAKAGPQKIHWVLLLIGVIVNLWGILWINKFGWVSF